MPGEPLTIPAIGCSGPTVWQELQAFWAADLGETHCLTHGGARGSPAHLSKPRKIAEETGRAGRAQGMLGPAG